MSDRARYRLFVFIETVLISMVLFALVRQFIASQPAWLVLLADYLVGAVRANCFTAALFGAVALLTIWATFANRGDL